LLTRKPVPLTGAAMRLRPGLSTSPTAKAEACSGPRSPPRGSLRPAVMWKASRPPGSWALAKRFVDR